MSIEYRSVTTQAEYLAAEDLQYAVWGGSEREIIPLPMLLTAHKHGGIVLGAFDQAALIGLVFSFIGFSAQQKLKHCSHLLAVDPAYRDQQVGRKLKLLQREVVLAQGIDLITWTYDPLESRNALLNLHYLGTTCQTYLPNLYGSMVDALNAGLPSDRFQVDWWLNSQHVQQCLQAPRPTESLQNLLNRGVTILNPASLDDPTAPAHEIQPARGTQVLIRIPADFQSLKATNPTLGLAWRIHFREVCQAAFEQGYMAADALRDGEQTYYMLQQG
jgi:predicted GNAT superfamily acetyltransferase